MATINQLPTLSTPTGTENVVIQNDNSNYKMKFSPEIYARYENLAGGTTPEVIQQVLNNFRNDYGDLINYRANVSAGAVNWSNGLYITMSSFKLGNYCAWTGICISQRGGVYAFQRWDTIGGAAGTLRTSELGIGLA